MSLWSGTAWFPVFGESIACAAGFNTEGPRIWYQKGIDDTDWKSESSAKSTNSRLTMIKSLLTSFLVLATGVLVLDRPLTFAEIFTEGVRVSPETVTRSMNS